MNQILMKLKINFVILLSFLSSCSHIEIKNSEWCGDLGSYGASCFNTLSEDTRDINNEHWNEERFGMICTKPQTFADWKKAILKLCRLNPGRCSFEDKKKVLIFEDKINAILLKTDNLSQF